MVLTISPQWRLDFLKSLVLTADINVCEPITTNTKDLTHEEEIYEKTLELESIDLDCLPLASKLEGRNKEEEIGEEKDNIGF